MTTNRPKGMDATERLVKRYLDALQLGLVVFEPDGNIPPDFTVDGRIAVEARRLNQNFKGQGLEEVSAALTARIFRILDDMGPALNGESWWIWLTFRRPIGLDCPEY